MIHKMPELPYEMEALAPLMSKETLEYHYGKHLKAYVDNLNNLISGTPFEEMELEEIVRKAEGGIFNNAAQAWNHRFFFEGMTPGGKAMPAALEAVLSSNFGSVQEFKAQFVKAAATLFGSGWVWLVQSPDGTLSIRQESNAGTPLRSGQKPLLVIDVWEHAYYVDYRNRRADYIGAFWSLIDWKRVASLL